MEVGTNIGSGGHVEAGETGGLDIKFDQERFDKAKALVMYRENDLYNKVVEKLKEKAGDDIYIIPIPRQVSEFSEEDRQLLKSIGEKCREKIDEHRSRELKKTLFDDTMHNTVYGLEKDARTSLARISFEIREIQKRLGGVEQFEEILGSVAKRAKEYGAENMSVVLGSGGSSFGMNKDRNTIEELNSDCRMAEHGLFIRTESGEEEFINNTNNIAGKMENPAETTESFKKIYNFFKKIFEGYGLTVYPSFDFGRGVAVVTYPDFDNFQFDSQTKKVTGLGKPIELDPHKTAVILDRHVFNALAEMGGIYNNSIFIKHDGNIVEDISRPTMDDPRKKEYIEFPIGDEDYSEALINRTVERLLKRI